MKPICLALAAAILFLAGAASIFPRRAELRKKDIADAFEQLRDDAGALYRAARPGTPPLLDDPDDRRPKLKDGDATAGVEDLENELARTRRIIADLVRQSLMSEKHGTEAPLPTHQFDFSRPGQSVEWRSQTDCRSLIVANDGPSSATDVRILLDGKSLPVTVEEIIGNASQNAAGEKQKATALWKAVVEGRRHDWPAHKEAEDPVKLFGVYGYGFCSHAAHALAALARQAGMTSRVLQSRGKHLVAEIMVDGKWAVFDPDAETCYPMPEGRLASAEDLRLDPGLLAGSPSPIYSEAKLRDFYTSTDLRESEPSDPAAAHGLHVTLRPGESIEYSRARRGLFFSSKYLDEPREYANGEWRFVPRADGELWLKGCQKAANIRSVRESGGRWIFTAAENGSPARITYDFALPYPALDGEIQVEATGGRPVAEISRDGSNWREIAAQSPGDELWRFPLAGHLHRVSGAPDYKFEIRLTFSPDAGPLRIGSIVYRFDLQMARRYLPLPSRETAALCVRYTSDGPATIRVRAICGTLDE